MKIRVEHRNGRMETITLIEPVEITEGDQMSKLRSAEGMDHFFNAQGYYDGWGMALPEGVQEGDAKEIIERVEGSREIEL